MTDQQTLDNQVQIKPIGMHKEEIERGVVDRKPSPSNTSSPDTQKTEEEIEKEIIEKIKSKLQEENIMGGIISSEELEPLDELKKKSYSDSLFLGLLYFKCHNILEENKSIEGVDYLLKKFPLNEDFHKLIESYETQKFGNYYLGIKIRDYVMKEKKEMSKLIDIFFSLAKQSI